MGKLEMERQGRKNPIPAVQVSYPQQKIYNNQRNIASSVRGKKQDSFYGVGGMKKIFTFLF